jgi:glycyl-tRNA synthetase
MSEIQMDQLVSLCKRRGFIFQSSEIYGGINGFWDYGPYGAAMKRAVENLWWKEMVEKRSNVEGLDSTVICHPKVWDASGHTAQFADCMVDNKVSKKRYRLDTLLEAQEEGVLENLKEALGLDSTSPEALEAALKTKGKDAPAVMKDAGVADPDSDKADWTEPRQFNLMMKTYVGPVSDEDHVAYLRAETCQPIFVDFNQVRVSARQKLPFGIAQIGKAFRNEINPRNFIFRSREFSQMEMEYFCKDEDAMEWYEYWKNERINYYKNILGFSDDMIKIHEHENLAHYAKAALDIEFKFPFGWGELEGIHHRGTWDLSRHQEYSGESLEYFEQESKSKFTPTVIETSVGVDRTILALLCNAYDEDMAETKKEGKQEDVRVVMRFPAKVAPVQVAILPLAKKLSEQANAVYQDVGTIARCEFDVTGSIGKRYRRQDEIGTPYCVTFDFDSLEDNAVTVRDRDTMQQERVSMDQLKTYFIDKLL